MDTELRGIEIEDGISVAELLAEGIVAADGIDLLTGVLGHIRHLMEDMPAAQGEVPAGDVEARHEEIAARSRLCEVDDLTHVAFIDIRSRQ